VNVSLRIRTVRTFALLIKKAEAIPESEIKQETGLSREEFMATLDANVAFVMSVIGAEEEKT